MRCCWSSHGDCAWANDCCRGRPSQKIVCTQSSCHNKEFGILMWPGFIRGKEDTAALPALGSSSFSREAVIKSQEKGRKDNGNQRQLWFACVNTKEQLWHISSSSHYCHITMVLQELHWLPVRFRMRFKILLVIFKAIHGLAPTHIMNLISVKKKIPIAPEVKWVFLGSTFLQVEKDVGKQSLFRGCTQVMEKLP